MDIYASDDEKGEEIKQWWRDNGRTVIVSIVVGAACLFAGRYWMNYQATMSTKASLNYQQVVMLLEEDKKIDADTQAQLLFSEYASTPYAVFAAFDLSAKSVETQDNEAAKNYLQWIIDHAELAGHKTLAELRLSKLLLADSKYDEALQLINKEASISFASLFAELKGDILAAQGKNSDAHTAYQTAMMTINNGEPRQQLLQLKLDDMAIAQ